MSRAKPSNATGRSRRCGFCGSCASDVGSHARRARTDRGPFLDLLAVPASECMRRGKSADLPSDPGAAVVGGPEMNSGIDAGVDDFADAFTEGGEMALET